MYTKNTPFKEAISLNQQKAKKKQKTHGDVWQDKGAAASERVSVFQPAPDKRGIRSRPLNTMVPHSQNTLDHKNTLVPLHLWVKPILKAEVQRQSALAGLSTSATGAALLEEIIRQKLHIQQAATLETVIGKLFEKSQRALAKRIVAILIRIAFDTGQTRVLAANILGCQPGMTEKSIKEILQMGDTRTKANLTRRTVQVKELEDAIEKYLLAEDEEERKNNKEGRGE